MTPPECVMPRIVVPVTRTPLKGYVDTSAATRHNGAPSTDAAGVQVAGLVQHDQPRAVDDRRRREPCGRIAVRGGQHVPHRCPVGGRSGGVPGAQHAIDADLVEAVAHGDRVVVARCRRAGRCRLPSVGQCRGCVGVDGRHRGLERVARAVATVGSPPGRAGLDGLHREEAARGTAVAAGDLQPHPGGAGDGRRTAEHARAGQRHPCRQLAGDDAPRHRSDALGGKRAGVRRPDVRQRDHAVRDHRDGPGETEDTEEARWPAEAAALGRSTTLPAPNATSVQPYMLSS